MIFFGKDIFKKVISICKRRMGVCFLTKEMFSELLKRLGDRGKEGSHREGRLGEPGWGARGLRCMLTPAQCQAPG